jgi:propionyl-CoA carboxylase alpha chain
MRVVNRREEMAEGFRAAASEARSSFGDERVFIEKYITRPRHIEIQVLGDRHGNIVYLGERECSIQRRHQKVIEEAPSLFLTPEVRAAMGEQAVALARAVGYHSAGTVEFIVDQDRNFYFLEMNTRLQVEHPVTELVTGVDLVEQMIRVAAGEALTLEQKDVRLDGWAIEARVYAEDARRGFLPSIGRVTDYHEPAGPGIRVDAGTFEGGEISMYYDPMIAKLIAYGEDRQQATERLLDALDGYDIRGVTTNLDFLSSLLAHPRFRRGDISTNFITEEYPDGYQDPEVDGPAREQFAVIAAYVRAQQELRARHVHAGDADSPWKVLKRAGRGG